MVFWVTEKETKFNGHPGEGGQEQKLQRPIWRESELGEGRSFCRERALQLLRGEKELERKEKK